MNTFRFSGEKPLIYLITEGAATVENFTETKAQILEIIKIAVESNINLIQIREKQIPARLVYELAHDAAKLTKQSQTKLLVNDRADIALAANADGVHLASNSLPVDVIRKNFPADFVIGVSAHSSEKLELARNLGANFAAFSPIFFTPDKGEPKGIEKLREACEQLNDFPIIALGGVDETNYAEVLKTGASGFAAIRFLNNAENLKNLSAEYERK